VVATEASTHDREKGKAKT
jgi:hypothetical protein